MKQRKNISEPMTLDVLLSPFLESFHIVPSDTTEQWYYANDNSFLPDRETAPLILTPTLEVQDPDTGSVYKPTFYLVKWFMLNSETGEYDIEITNTEEGEEVEFVKLTNGQLLVKKNVAYDTPVDLLCQCTYIDPRNTAVTYTTTCKQSLTTNKDAAVILPVVDIKTEKVVHYDRFENSTSLFTFLASVLLGGEDITDASVIKWYATDDNITTETLIDATEDNINKFPCYVSGQGTKTLVVDAMYAERITIIARVYDTANSKLYPAKCFRTLAWVATNVSSLTTSENGGDVRESSTEKTFYNIVNTKTRTLSKDEVNAEFIQQFYLRKASKTTSTGVTATDTPELIGTSSEVKVSAAKLKSNISSLVYSELTQHGPNKVVSQDGKVVMQDGKVVFGRD